MFGKLSKFFVQDDKFWHKFNTKSPVSPRASGPFTVKLNGSNTKKGGSRETKGHTERHKGTGSGRFLSPGHPSLFGC